MINYFDVAKKISSELEYDIETNKIKAVDISNFIGMTPENFSKIRCELRGGKIPSPKFLIGISIFFKKNFCQF